MYSRLECVDPVAQSVEHNTFNVGVPGSSPGGITEEISDNHTIVGDFFVSARIDIGLYTLSSVFIIEAYSIKIGSHLIVATDCNLHTLIK